MLDIPIYIIRKKNRCAVDLFRAMEIFVKVAAVRNFSQAARETYSSQSSISKMVSSLEDHLGTKLLNRSTRSVELTETGKEYLVYCVKILEDVAQSEALLTHSHEQTKGLLRVSVPMTFGRMYILPFILKFASSAPELEVDLIMDDKKSDLVKEGVDVAIRIGILSDSSLIARKIGESPRGTFASKDYLSKFGEPQSPKELKHHNCIVYKLHEANNTWNFKGKNGLKAINVQGRLKTNSPDAIREAMISGFGIGMTPYWLVKDLLEKEKICEILTDYTPPSFNIYAVYPDRRFLPQKVRLFVEALQDYILQNV